MRAANVFGKAGKILMVAAAAISLTVSSFFISTPFHEALSVQAADGSLEMSTDYPGIATKPGQTVSFSLDFNNTGDGTSVALSSTGLPDGWTDEFDGNGSKISAAYAKSGENDALVTYRVNVPDDAKNGDYSITLHANSASLVLTLNVTDEETGDSGLTTDDTEQEGPTGTTFTYSLTLTNNSATDQTYALSAQKNDGWTVTFRPSDGSNNVASINVDAHGSTTLTATVTPPEKVDAGDYEIPVSAVSADQNLSATLQCKITGTYALDVTTASQTLSFDANAGSEKDVTITVTNNGNIDLENISLSVTAPDGWDVSFDPASIDSIAAGQSASTTLKVTPSKNAVSGDYTMTISAENDNTSQDATFRVTVKTGTAWGIAGVVIIVAVIAALMGIFHKFGRH